MPFDVMKWYRRTALMYAIGTWTLLGSCVYYTLYGDSRGINSKEEENDNDEPQNVKIYKSTYMTTKITYKENFVPYSTRFMNLFRPKTENTTESEFDEK